MEGHHEAIISPEEFAVVQAEVERRRHMGKYSGVGVFSSIIKCGECGYWYGPKVLHSNDKYKETNDAFINVGAEIARKKSKAEFFKDFIRSLKESRKAIEEFDESLWGSLVGSITAYSKDNVVFTFKNGHEIQVSLLK